jgi:hypothetical protein
MAKLLAGCIALAALSLLLPSELSYDPWAWLVWGREIAHAELDTSGGPSWKPLPVLAALAFWPFSSFDVDIPPALWMVAARAGGLLALALVFRLAARLAGPDRLFGALAGTAAAVALLFSPDWLRYLAHGSEAPLAVALMLLAVERQLDGVRHQALVLLVLACLLRPEVLPFLAGYALYVQWAEPRRRLLIAGSLALLATLWIVPEWIGSGNPLDAARQATSEPSWSLSLEERPWLAALERVYDLLGLQLLLGALAGVAVALLRRQRAALVLAGVAAVWGALYVTMTQLGFSGNARYVLPALVIAGLLAGIGAAGTLQSAMALARRGSGEPRAGLAGLAAAWAALLAMVAAPYVVDRSRQLRAEAREALTLAGLHRDLVLALRAVGGRAEITRLGYPTANRPFHTRLAWELELRIPLVERGPRHPLVFHSDDPVSLPVGTARRPRRGHHIAAVGDWQVYLASGRPAASFVRSRLGEPRCEALRRSNGGPIPGRRCGPR